MSKVSRELEGLRTSAPTCDIFDSKIHRRNLESYKNKDNMENLTKQIFFTFIGLNKRIICVKTVSC